MSDNIPFHIQMEIIKKVSDIKSLFRFRSVSKPWKSFIDSSDFIKAYGARHTQPHSRILSYRAHLSDLDSHFCLVDDNMETLQVQELVVSPLLKQCFVYRVVGGCHGLLCLYCSNKSPNYRWMVVIWNPSIGKSFGIAAPDHDQTVYGFGVCPVTKDPTVVKIKHSTGMPWHVEVFTLSSRVWNVIPSGYLPRQSIQLSKPPTQVVIDRFIYWGAWEKTFRDDGKSTINPMVVSFDLITKEFKVINLPNTLTNKLLFPLVSVSKLRGSLVVYGPIVEEGVHCFGVWVMVHDLSFRKLFTIGTLTCIILGSSKSGEIIFETRTKGVRLPTLDAYDPCSQQIKNLGIYGANNSFFMGSYKESLLLLDHSDSHIYSREHRGLYCS